MENKSIWQLYMRKNYTDKLDKNIETDVLIIGGGITGITTAYFLKDTNLNVTLIEKDHIGSGATAFTTGKLTYMQDLIYHKMNENIAKKYLDSQKDAIKIVKDIINKNNIECNLEATTSYVFTDEYSKINNFKLEQSMYDKLNIKYKSGSRIPIKFPCIYSLKTSGSYVFHPLKYLYSLKKILLSSNINIYEKTKAIDIDNKEDYYIVKTEANTIKAKYVVIATQYPFFVIPYFTPFKTEVEKSYIVAGLIEKNKKIQAISNQKPVHSIRYYTNKNKKYIMYSSGSHKITDHICEEENYKAQVNKFKKELNSEVKYYFLNQDIMTDDGMPLIGRINNSNLLIATGYNKWGMTNGTIAGKIISDIILNKDNKYIELFKVHRKINLQKITKLTIYNYSNMKRYIISKVKTNYSFYNDNVKVVTENGIKYGIYTDKTGKEYKVKNVCPHMKCNLIFNNIDKTWDCPCHGSRFDKEGNVLFGPSVYNIKLEEEIKKEE